MNRGGAREGAGRPRGNRTRSISVRVSVEAYEIYQSWENKAAEIDALIRASNKHLHTKPYSASM